MDKSGARALSPHELVSVKMLMNDNANYAKCEHLGILILSII